MIENVPWFLKVLNKKEKKEYSINQIKQTSEITSHFCNEMTLWRTVKIKTNEQHLLSANFSNLFSAVSGFPLWLHQSLQTHHTPHLRKKKKIMPTWCNERNQKNEHDLNQWVMQRIMSFFNIFFYGTQFNYLLFVKKWLKVPVTAVINQVFSVMQKNQVWQ